VQVRAEFLYRPKKPQLKTRKLLYVGVLCRILQVVPADDGIFLGVLIVEGAGASLNKSTALVKSAGGGVGGPHFKQYSDRVLLPGPLQKAMQKLRSEPPAAGSSRYHDVFQFPLRAGRLGDQECLHGAIFSDQAEARWGIRREDRFILGARPVGGCGRRPL
jgi:hypothetical protein